MSRAATSKQAGTGLRVKLLAAFPNPEPTP
jgi:hypothetical protein